MNGEERAGLGGCVEVLEGTNGREQTNSSLAWLSIPPGWPQCLRSYISPISRLLPWGAAPALCSAHRNPSSSSLLGAGMAENTQAAGHGSAEPGGPIWVQTGAQQDTQRPYVLGVQCPEPHHQH